MPLTYFKNRQHAGQLLAKQLAYADEFKHQTIVLAIPRGGVPVAFPIARHLNLLLDVIIARKIPHPRYPESGIGAISEHDTYYWDQNLLDNLNISDTKLEYLKFQQEQELASRIKRFRNGHPLPDLTDTTVILVDDGLATGVTTHAAISAIEKHDPLSIILALPVCPKILVQKLQGRVHKLVTLIEPTDMQAISQYYHDFTQVTDEQVTSILNSTSNIHNAPNTFPTFQTLSKIH